MTRSDLLTRLRALAEEMTDIGTAMDYYGGTAEWSKHGLELCGAASLVREWVGEIEPNGEVRGTSRQAGGASDSTV